MMITMDDIHYGRNTSMGERIACAPRPKLDFSLNRQPKMPHKMKLGGGAIGCMFQVHLHKSMMLQIYSKVHECRAQTS